MVKAVKQGYPRSKEKDPKLGANRTEIIEIEYNLCKFSQLIQIGCAKNFFYLLLVIAWHTVSLLSLFLLLLYRDLGKMSTN